MLFPDPTPPRMPRITFDLGNRPDERPRAPGPASGPKSCGPAGFAVTTGRQTPGTRRDEQRPRARTGPPGPSDCLAGKSTLVRRCPGVRTELPTASTEDVGLGSGRSPAGVGSSRWPGIGGRASTTAAGVTCGSLSPVESRHEDEDGSSLQLLFDGRGTEVSPSCESHTPEPRPEPSLHHRRNPGFNLKGRGFVDGERDPFARISERPSGHRKEHRANTSLSPYL